ncbi:MAG: arylsulfatase, partial [Pirellulaceae bacterium]|nr:arylsulfatase [Pirellulaceae bacterium]
IDTCIGASKSDSQGVPNIVVILADDMGYGDVQALNPKSQIATPHLNALAAEGMTFTDAHTPSAVCTPTRYGLLTGRYCWRSRLKRGVLNGYSDPLIERDRPTVASVLSSQGYTTGIVGKWHLGLGWSRKSSGKSIDFAAPVQHGPNDLGFDESLVIPASLDFPPYVYIRNGKVTDQNTVIQNKQPFPKFLREGPRANDLVMEEVLDHLTEQAGNFIRREAKTDAPFFLYVPLTAPHKPVLPHPRFRGKSKLGPYGDFIMQVDWTAGQIIKAVDDAGVRDNTLLIFTSDNGSFMHRLDQLDAKDHVSDQTIQAYRADHHTSNHLFRGTKADIWEAGHHVPFFVRWPQRVKPGTTSAATVCLTDVFATAAQVAETKIPAGAARDSHGFLDALDGRPFRRAEPVIHHSSGGMFAIREGKWKLVLGNGSGGRQAPRGKPFTRPYGLFDLHDDIGETRNVIAEAAAVAKELEQTFEPIHKGG